MATRAAQPDEESGMTLEERYAAAERAILRARKLKRYHVGFASDSLIADRRAEVWREIAKDIDMHGS